MICYGHVSSPNIELPLAKSNQTADNAATVHANPHVHFHLVVLSNLVDNKSVYIWIYYDACRHLLPDLLDDFDHFETHFDAILGVVVDRVRQSGNAVITISQDFDSQTIVLLNLNKIRTKFVPNYTISALYTSGFVEFAEEFVQH